MMAWRGRPARFENRDTGGESGGDSVATAAFVYVGRADGAACGRVRWAGAFPKWNGEETLWWSQSGMASTFRWRWDFASCCGVNLAFAGLGFWGGGGYGFGFGSFPRGPEKSPRTLVGVRGLAVFLRACEPVARICSRSWRGLLRAGSGDRLKCESFTS